MLTNHQHEGVAVLTVRVDRSATGTLTLAVQPEPGRELSGPDLMAVAHALSGLIARMASR